MSSDGDIVAVQTSLNDNLADASTVHFSGKNYTFITDSTSNSGSFSSGQIQFDLSTLNSQSQWISLPEAVIEFPVKVTASVLTAGTGTETTKSIAAAATTIIKNGWHQWIDSAQLIINGQTIQSAQPYENVAGSFRILSSWSQDTLKKWGPTCGVALDDCTGDLTSIIARNSVTNSDINLSSASIQTTILGASAMKTAGQSHVSSVAAGSNTANGALYSAYYMATVRLRDLCDINDFPVVKNLKGFLYLSFNSSQVNLTGTAAALQFLL
ncbi:hypothetical protein AC1031_014939 [Aphanomyces cochlioides]|nr:hypothetical protein AC1031_014939 [Aphanomyces cochlioides]